MSTNTSLLKYSLFLGLYHNMNLSFLYQILYCVRGSHLRILFVTLQRKECIFCSHFKTINIIFRPNPQKENISYHNVRGNKLCLLFPICNSRNTFYIWHSQLLYFKEAVFITQQETNFMIRMFLCSISDHEKLTHKATLHSFVVE